MNPRIHLQTGSRNYAPVPYGTRLRVGCTIQELFSGGGHEFIDLQVNAFVRPTGQPVMSALLRAIYKARVGS